MFTVEGFSDGVFYTVVIDGGTHGSSIHGSTFIMRELSAREGEEFDVSPTGPEGRLDLMNPESVLGALLAWTKVTKVEGEHPDPFHGAYGHVPGVVY